jgi:hypothetical protein
MPDEFDNEAGTPENRLAISRKAVSCLALLGLLISSAEARWLITRVMP